MSAPDPMLDSDYATLDEASPVATAPQRDPPDPCGPPSLHTLDTDFGQESSQFRPVPETPPNCVPVISHPREAYLLKFFTQTWGPIFDCLDPNQTFTKSVLSIALTSFQPLFWAIMATSALQLSRLSNYPFSAAKYYRSQCSKSIMPLLLQEAHPEASEDALFATYVILRNYDHMTGRLTPLPDQLPCQIPDTYRS